MGTKHRITVLGLARVDCACGWSRAAEGPERWSGPAAIQDHLLDTYNVHSKMTEE